VRKSGRAADFVVFLLGLQAFFANDAALAAAVLRDQFLAHVEDRRRGAGRRQQRGPRPRFGAFDGFSFPALMWPEPSSTAAKRAVRCGEPPLPELATLASTTTDLSQIEISLAATVRAEMSVPPPRRKSGTEPNLRS
jgi:hypothetical protein